MIVKEAELFKGISVEVLERIASASEHKEFKAKEVIFKVGDEASGLYVLEDGKVDVYIPAEGRSGIHFLLSDPGEVFGFMALADPPVHVSTATAVSDTKALKIPVEVLLKLLSTPSPDGMVLARNLLRVLAQRLKKAYQLVASEILTEAEIKIVSYG